MGCEKWEFLRDMIYGRPLKKFVINHLLHLMNFILFPTFLFEVLGVYVSSIRGKLQIKVSGDVQTLHSEEKADLFVKNFEKELEYLLK